MIVVIAFMLVHVLGRDGDSHDCSDGWGDWDGEYLVAMVMIDAVYVQIGVMYSEYFKTMFMKHIHNN